MTIIQKLELIERLDGLIRRKATGNPRALARRLNISERSVYNLIDQMKNMGAPVNYCRALNSYHYEWAVGFKFGFEKLENSSFQAIGGVKTNYSHLQDIFVTANFLQSNFRS